MKLLFYPDTMDDDECETWGDCWNAEVLNGKSKFQWVEDVSLTATEYLRKQLT